MNETIGFALVFTFSIAVLVLYFTSPEVAVMLGRIENKSFEEELLSFTSELDISILSVLDGGSTIKKLYSPGVKVNVLYFQDYCEVCYSSTRALKKYVYPVEVRFSKTSIDRGPVTVKIYRGDSKVCVDIRER